MHTDPEQGPQHALAAVAQRISQSWGFLSHTLCSKRRELESWAAHALPSTPPPLGAKHSIRFSGPLCSLTDSSTPAVPTTKAVASKLFVKPGIVVKKKPEAENKPEPEEHILISEVGTHRSA